MSKLDNAVVGLVSGHLRSEAKLHSDMAIHDRLIAWAEGIEGVLARAEKAEAHIAEYKTEREYIHGFNAGFDEAKEQMKLPPFPTMLRKMWSGQEVQQWIDAALKEQGP